MEAILEQLRILKILIFGIFFTPYVLIIGATVFVVSFGVIMLFSRNHNSFWGCDAKSLKIKASELEGSLNQVHLTEIKPQDRKPVLDDLESLQKVLGERINELQSF